MVGATDKEGAEPVDHKCAPDDVAATFLRAMGIDHHTEYHTPDGRPVLVMRDGAPLEELFV